MPLAQERGLPDANLDRFLLSAVPQLLSPLKPLHTLSPLQPRKMRRPIAQL
jgi:hypothetical protein